MAAQNKGELLEISKKEFEKLNKLIDTINPGLALSRDEDDTSIKDVVAHRAHWIELFLGWYSDGLAGKPVFFPAKGYKWNELKRYNADLRAKQSSMDWNEAQEALQKNYEKLIKLLESCSSKQLYSGPMKGANNNWGPGRWAEAAGPSNFRSASKYIRARLKSM